MPYLTDKARALVGRMDQSKSSKYNEVKELILRECKLTLYIKDGILFHRGVVAGQDCEQLCVPVTRRTQVLTLAHEVYGAHLGPSKTKDRIRLSFYWPTLSADSKQHCRTCKPCQKRAKNNSSRSRTDNSDSEI